MTHTHDRLLNNKCCPRRWEQAYCVRTGCYLPSAENTQQLFCAWVDFELKQNKAQKNNEWNLLFLWGELSWKISSQMAEDRWPCPQNFMCLARFRTEEKNNKLAGGICCLPHRKDNFESRRTPHSPLKGLIFNDIAPIQNFIQIHQSVQ
jgi:hypothetical protein